MATNANDVAGNDHGLNLGDQPQNTNNNSDLTSDPTISKHLDMAIEAQDGKAPDKNADPSGGKEAGTDKDGAAPGSKGDKDSASGRSDGAPKQPIKPEGKKEEKPTAGAKDLVDAQGNVVAKAGAERRLYEQLGVSRQQNEHLTTRLSAAEARATEAEKRLQSIEQTVQQVNGMKPSDLAVASNIFNDLQKDPVGTMKKLLAEVVAAGHTIEGIGAGVDAMAISRAVEAHLAKHGQTTAEPNEQQLVADAEKEVNTFYSQYPDARPHDELLAKVIRDNPGTDLSTAYFQLKGAFIDRGFDWNLTLEDNLKEQNPNPTNTQEQPQKPITNGRAPEGSAMKPATETVVAHENTDMGDIVREAMREQGLKID